MKFVIEHMEQEMYGWCIIEYEHIASFVGNLLITNVKEEDIDKVKGFAEATSSSVAQLRLKNACVLDPDAENILSPGDKFDYLIFGGILGEYPAKKRTKGLVVPNAERRNLGKQQMATDNAVYAAKLITEGTPFQKIPFQDGIEIETNEGESVQFPYRYVLVDGKPLVSKKLIELLKKQEGL